MRYVFFGRPPKQRASGDTSPSHMPAQRFTEPLPHFGAGHYGLAIARLFARHYRSGCPTWASTPRWRAKELNPLCPWRGISFTGYQPTALPRSETHWVSAVWREVRYGSCYQPTALSRSKSHWLFAVTAPQSGGNE